jgi:hypothetical protein
MKGLHRWSKLKNLGFLGKSFSAFPDIIAKSFCRKYFPLIFAIPKQKGA